MNCQELTTAISNIKAQITELDSAVGARNPKEALNIKNDIIKQFNGEFKELVDNFYRNPTPENYYKEVNRILKIIGDRDPSEVTFSRRQLIFIYDTDDKAKYGDFNQESRNIIKTTRKQRNSREDILTIYKCLPYEITWAEDFISPGTPRDRVKAWAEEYVSPETKIYIGPLFPGIFDLPNLEHIYTSFPEGEIRRGEFTTCGKTGPELEEDLEARGIGSFNAASGMLHSSKFVAHKANETIPTILLKVSDLFHDRRTHTYEEIITRVRFLGLNDNLPQETASNLLLSELTQPKPGQWYSVASKTIADLHDYPNVFSVYRNDDGLRLRAESAHPEDKWSSVSELMFGLRSEPEQSSV